MLEDSERITWLASYPKSGNTWVRCLLHGYRTHGHVDINDLYTGVGDSSAAYTRAVCPLPLDMLGIRGQWQLRPAALLAAMVATPVPRFFKTHYANLVVAAAPAFIPFELTQRAIYVVRDPRSVALSCAKYFGMSVEDTVTAMNTKEFNLADRPDDEILQTAQVLSTWSIHVASWIEETKFPVLLVRYEDLLLQPVTELKRMVEFLGKDFDRERADKAVRAAELSRLQGQEAKHGFRDNRTNKGGVFFSKGGTRWQSELAPELIEQIELDHSDVMQELGYTRHNKPREVHHDRPKRAEDRAGHRSADARLCSTPNPTV